MEKQRWEESERRREEETRSEKRKSEKKEDAGARKGTKVANHCVFPMICGSRGSNRLAKAAGAEPSGQMRDEKLHAIVARRAFRSQNVQSTTCTEQFWKLRCRKSARRCGEKHMSKAKCTKHLMFGDFLKLRCRKSAHRCGAKHISKSKVQKAGALLDVQRSFCGAGERDGAPCQKGAKPEGFVAVSKTMAGVGHLKRICKDVFPVAGTAQETCSSEMLGGQGAHFLRGVAFWSIRSSGLLR